MSTERNLLWNRFKKQTLTLNPHPPCVNRTLKEREMSRRASSGFFFSAVRLPTSLCIYVSVPLNYVSRVSWQPKTLLSPLTPRTPGAFIDEEKQCNVARHAVDGMRDGGRALCWYSRASCVFLVDSLPPLFFSHQK